MITKDKQNTLIWLGLAISAIVPFLFPNHITLLTYIWVMIILALTWDMLGGQTGYTSFANILFDNVSSGFNLIIMLIIILGGGFNILDQFIRSLNIHSEIILGILFFFIFFIFNEILSIPFQYYKTFIIFK